MQRPVGFPRTADENCIINITPNSPQGKYSPRGSVDDTGGGFQINNDAQSGIIHHHLRRSRFRLRQKWAFFVPFTILLICLIIFWLFPFPVKLVNKDGRIIAVFTKNGMPLPLETRRIL